MRTNLKRLFVYKKIWVVFFLIKVFYMFFALFVFSKFVQLGDMQSYLNGTHYNPSLMFFSSTLFTGTISHVLYIFVGLIGTSFIFMFLSFYGTYYSVKKMNLSKNSLILILILFSFPSFSIWTTIPGKEAISIFFMGILFGYLVDFINKIRFFNFLEFFSLYLGLLFKPQYIIPFILCLIYIYIRKKFNLKKYVDIFLIIFFIFLAIMIIFIFQKELNDLFYIIPNHFSLEANSTRQEAFWQKDFDFLYKLPEGVFLSFIGPSIFEVLNRKEMFPIFLESIVIIIILFYIMIRNFNLKINTLNINILIFLVLGILILSYPLGVSNYMTAIRYRAGYYVFLIEIIFYIFLVRNKSIKRNG